MFPPAPLTPTPRYPTPRYPAPAAPPCGVVPVFLLGLLVSRLLCLPPPLWGGAWRSPFVRVGKNTGSLQA